MSTPPFFGLQVASMLFFLPGVLLLTGSSDVSLATGAVFLGLAAVVHSYAWWYALHQQDGWRNPGKFVREVAKPILVAVYPSRLCSSGPGAWCPDRL